MEGEYDPDEDKVYQDALVQANARAVELEISEDTGDDSLTGKGTPAQAAAAAAAAAAGQMVVDTAAPSVLGKREDHPSPAGSVPTSTEVSPARKAARTEDEGAAPEPAPAPASAPDSGYVSSDGTGTSGGLSRPPLVVRTTSGGINLAGGGGGAQAGVELAMTAVERWNAQRAAAAAAAAGRSAVDRRRRAAGGDDEMSNQ